jgi:amino acid permease
VFPARYDLNSYIVFRKRLVSKRLSHKELAYVSRRAKYGKAHETVCLSVLINLRGFAVNIFI